MEAGPALGLRDGAEEQTDRVPTSCRYYSRGWGNRNCQLIRQFQVVIRTEEMKQDNGIGALGKDE